MLDIAFSNTVVIRGLAVISKVLMEPQKALKIFLDPD